MENVFIALLLLSLLSTAICTLGFVICWIIRKPKKQWGIAALISFVLVFVFGIATVSVSCTGEYHEVSRTEPTCTTPGKVISKCDKCDDIRTETLEPIGHKLIEVSRTEPSADYEGKVVQRCEVCNEEIITLLPKLQKQSDTAETSSENQAESKETKAQIIDFSEIYKAYEENELRAKETYQYNQYQITAKVNGMETDGLFNMTGGATLTMEYKVDNTVVFFYAEFEKEQEENLKKINVGDTITFKGKCLSAGSWSECEIVK